MDFTISPDSIVFWRSGPFVLNATIVFTWVVMLILSLGSVLITRNLSPTLKATRWQSLVEMVVLTIRDQVREVAGRAPNRYLPFIGTLFLFISLSNLLVIVPGWQAPTGSLSTTLALALCVFFAVPIFSIAEQGVAKYLKGYIDPSPIMLPFRIISEISRTGALAIRLFGNIMSGTLIVGILVAIIPLFVPIVMQVLGLLIGQIQAYIFAALAMVYIVSAAQATEEVEQIVEEQGGPNRK
jgi:F-type H+-transporting ATPase subunit a